LSLGYFDLIPTTAMGGTMALMMLNPIRNSILKGLISEKKTKREREREREVTQASIRFTEDERK
jgi:hypothetical protein